jgi:DNA-binding response OmpR family regulator
VSSNSKAKILVVDDEPDIVAMLKVGLQRHGFEVEGYSDPRESLSHFRPKHYDLILMDIRMPYMNGIELARELFKLDNDVRISFMSAYETNPDDIKELNFTPLFFLRKTISIKRIAEQIEPIVAGCNSDKLNL